VTFEPTLVLNADYQPISLHPLSVWNWQDTIKAVFLDKVVVVAEYDTLIRSERQSWRLPSVIALKEYRKREEIPVFSRYNIFLRDNFSCQYCGKHGHTNDLTFDHVIPRHAGGQTTWENVVAACSGCNWQKGGKLLFNSGMKLLNAPRQPSSWELYQKCIGHLDFDKLHQSWIDYLYWDGKLEN
jgi:5-methylcytosine-specific restriction endonuclease McrA